MKLGKFNERQLIMMAIAFLATMGILFGGQALNSKFRVDNPLQKEIMAIRGVQHFQLVQDKDKLTAQLKLGRVTDLQQVLEAVNQKVQKYHNQPVNQFVITDRANRALDEARYQLSFYMEEAAVSGHYIQLKQELDTLQGVHARVYLGQEFIYIQLEQGSHYLYQAVPRSERGMALDNKSGGDSAG